mmetsp:Transcript_18142/g.39555  ORF Transcript_18142/g.39555 Transcript_18142/m.39555 type:complete len:100 (+) Transcript_18142:43-342(+)
MEIPLLPPKKTISMIIVTTLTSTSIQNESVENFLKILINSSSTTSYTLNERSEPYKRNFHSFLNGFVSHLKLYPNKSSSTNNIIAWGVSRAAFLNSSWT